MDKRPCLKNEYTYRCITHYHNNGKLQPTAIKEVYHICNRSSCFGIYIMKSSITLKSECEFGQFDDHQKNHLPICRYCNKEFHHLDTYYHLWGCFYCCKKIDKEENPIIYCENCTNENHSKNLLK